MSLGQCQLVARRPETASRVTGSASTRRYIRPETMADKPLTAEAQARLDALPDNFAAFITAPERFFARPEAA